MARNPVQIDLNKLRREIRKLPNEGGSWQAGVDWPRILPAWFKVRSAIDGPEDFAKRITALLSRLYRHGRDKMLAVARSIATPQQRKAVDEIAGGPTA